MPAVSQQQRKLIFAKRGQYGTKEKTPKKWKWVWEEGYENKGELPERVQKEGFIRRFDSFLNEDKEPSWSKREATSQWGLLRDFYIWTKDNVHPSGTLDEEYYEKVFVSGAGREPLTINEMISFYISNQIR